MNAKLTDVHHVGLNRFHAYTGLESALTELPKLEDGATYGYQFYAQDTGNTYLFNESTNTYDRVKSSGGGGGDVGEGVLTLMQGDETLGTFSANATEDTTIALKTTSAVTENDNSLVTSGGVKTAIDNAILTRLTTHICIDGEYDTETLVPTLEGDPKTLYLTPKATDDEVNAYIEWLYINEKFERIGSTEVVIEGIDTATIDAITNDESKTGEQVLQTTGLSYLWTKLKAKFATLAHTHQSADITDLGTATLTVKSGEDTLGTFGANATEDVEIKIDKATVNDGKLTLKLMEGTSISTSEFSANQATDTETTIRTIPQSEKEYNYLRATSDGYYKWEEPASMVTTDNPCLVASNTVAEHLTNNYAQKTHTHKMADVTDLEIGDGQLILSATDGTDTINTKTFTANQNTNTSTYIRNVPTVKKVDSYLKSNANNQYAWQTPATDVSTDNSELVKASTVAEHLTNNYVPKTDLGQATLTVKSGEDTLGTFGANATEDTTISLKTTSAVTENDTSLVTSGGVKTAIDNAISTRLATHICVDGEYDTETLEPTLAGDTKTLYLTPKTTGSEISSYIEWLYADEKFKQIGSTEVVIENIDTATIDAIANDETKTGEQVLQTTGLTYLWTKLKAKFALLTHTHKTTDITDLATTYAKIDSPALTGTPTVPTATVGTSSGQQIANIDYIWNFFDEYKWSYVCGDGEYETDTRRPHMTGDVGTIYLTPAKNAGEYYEQYDAWIYVNNGDWQRLGGTDPVIKSIDTATIDAIANDETKTGTENLQTTGLTYLWSKIKGLFAPLTHTHKSADVTDLGTATLTLKKGETTLGTFGANATEDVSVDLGEDAEVNDGKLTLTVNDGMEQTSNEFTANQSADKTVYLNAVPENNTTGYLYNESSGTYSWVQPATTVSTTNSKLIQSSVIASHLQASYAPLSSPALTGTPTAPTASTSTDSTQIATTAFVKDVLEPTTILNGTDTNYVSTYANRASIQNVTIIKSGANYSVDIYFTLNSSAKSSYAAGEWWNIMTVGTTLKNLIKTPCAGLVTDAASNGNNGGLAIQTPNKNYFAISPTIQITADDTVVWHAYMSFIGTV